MKSVKVAIMATTFLLSLNSYADFEKARIGAENRVPVNNKAKPYRMVGRVEFSGGTCTGALVAKNIVLTNGHCVWDKSKKKWYTNFSFTPGYKNGDRPYGKYYAKAVVVSKKFKDGKSGADYGFIILSKNAGNKVGWFGTKAYKKKWNKKNFWTLSGYPSNYTGNPFSTSLQVAHKKCSIRKSIFAGRAVFHNCDTGQGSSGAPLFGHWSGKYYIVAVNYSGHGPRDGKRMKSCSPLKLWKCGNYAVKQQTFVKSLKKYIKKYK